MAELWETCGDLKSEVFRVEPKIDLLHQILGFGPFAEITVTSDGFFLGRSPGDIGFNEFLGKPSEAAKQRTGALFKNLNKCSQDQIMVILRAKSIKSRDIGIG